MGVLQLSTPSFASRCPHPLFHCVAALYTEPCSEMSASFVPFLPILGIAQKREPNATHRPWATFLQCIPGAPHSDEVLQMIDVGSSWVATICRPPQLAFVLSRAVCVLLGCSWAVSPIQILFRACPQTQMATATKKIPCLREAIKSKRSRGTLTHHSIFRLHASHLCSNTLVEM